MESAFRQAEKARRAGNFSQALDQYLIILADRLSALKDDSSSVLSAADLVVTERAAELAILFGHYKGADNLLAGMASSLESALNSFSADFITVKRIHLALSFGQLCRARKLLKGMSHRIGDVESSTFAQHGLEAWESSCRWNRNTPRDRAVIFSQLYLVLGWLATSLGQYHLALSMLDRGLAFTGQEAPDLARRAEVPLRLTIATAFLEQGELNCAEERLNDLAPLLDKKHRPGSYVRAAELRGKLRMLQGNFGGALLEYSEVLACCKDKTFARAELIAMLNLSQVLVFLNFISAAQHLLNVVVSRARTLKDFDTSARAKRLLAVARERSASFEGTAAVTQILQGRRDVDDLREVRPLEFSEIAPGEGFLSLFEERVLEFYWHLGDGNLDMASMICSHIGEAFGTSDSTLVLVRLQVIEGTLAYFTHDFARAERLLRESLPVLQAIGLSPDIWQTQRILSWCWLRLGFPIQEYQQLAANNQQVLATMTESLPPAYQAVYLLNKWTAEEEFIAGEINQLEKLKNTLTARPWYRRPGLRWSLMKRIYRLQQYIERYRDSLTGDHQHDAQTAEAEPSLLKLLWNHPKDRVTVSFLVLPDRVLIVHARRMKLDFEVVQASRIKVRELVRDWHAGLKGPAGRGAETQPGLANADLMNDEYLDTLVSAKRNLQPAPTEDAGNQSVKDAKSVAASLANELKIPELIKGFSRSIRALTIIPHDALLGFPFAAVHYEGSYLGEQFDISTDVGFVNRPPANKSVVEKKALLIGISARAAGYPELKGVPVEIKVMEQWCNERRLPYQVLMNDAATKSSIVRHLYGSSLLHIACHGVFRADQPDASGLVLITEAGQVEILSLRELSDMDLTNLRHVSLSSCSSADNFILPGRWIIGLPETLRRGGVESVLACLWTIDDRFATAFAARFYDYLRTHPRDKALKLTQLDCLKIKHDNGQPRPLENVDGIDTTDPDYWASYVLCGNHERLRL
jgi:CHAT domain-containing protein